MNDFWSAIKCNWRWHNQEQIFMLTWLSMTSKIVLCMTFSLFSNLELLSVMQNFSDSPSIYECSWKIILRWRRMVFRINSVCRSVWCFWISIFFMRIKKKALDTLERSKYKLYWNLIVVARHLKAEKLEIPQGKRNFSIFWFHLRYKMSSIGIMEQMCILFDGENVFLPNRSKYCVHMRWTWRVRNWKFNIYSNFSALC